MKRIDSFEYFRGKRCDVLGIGISNLPLIRMLVGYGAAVTARDMKEERELGEVTDELLSLGVRLVLGEGYLDGIDADVIFRSPGIRPDLPQIVSAADNGAIVTSEMALFCSLTKANIIAVTGSDGKTTTTTLTYKILEETAKRKDGIRVFVGGNIGAPILPRVAEMRECDFAVVELSSFQLQEMRYTPHRAIITNITPNHLNWHKDYQRCTHSSKQIALSELNGFIKIINAWLETEGEPKVVIKLIAGKHAGEVRIVPRSQALDYYEMGWAEAYTAEEEEA